MQGADGRKIFQSLISVIAVGFGRGARNRSEGQAQGKIVAWQWLPSFVDPH